MSDDRIKKTEDFDFIPVSLVSASQYCRRLAYLQFNHQERQDTADTIKGQRIHKAVDKESKYFPAPKDLQQSDKDLKAKSVTLSSKKWGVISRIDLLETRDSYVIPIEYKKGNQKTYLKDQLLPEELQVGLQTLILKDNGYLCDSGMIYYAGSKKRVQINFTDQLFKQTKQALQQLKKDIKKNKAPPPLEDSTKCSRCSLVEVCLPNEFYFLQNRKKKIRPISVPEETHFPVYVQSYKGRVSKKKYRLEIQIDEDNIKSIPIMDVSQLVLMGNISITTPCLHELMRREIPVTWLSYGGWFLGHTHGVGHKNAMLREAQYKKSFDDQFCLSFAKSLVRAKIYNCRTLLRRNWRLKEKPESTLRTLKTYAEKTNDVENFKELLGVEGYSAKVYFQSFKNLIKNQNDFSFLFNKRNRRPPEDPVNLMLSFSYALLARLWTVTLSSVGFDPYKGFYHQSRYGRPALALDMMESFRPLICDSTVLLAINNREIQPNQFIYHGQKVGWRENSRKTFISIFERRLSQKVKHPIFNYKLSYRQLLEVQARLFARYLFNEINPYPHFMTR